MPERIRSITSLLKQGVKIVFTPTMEVTVRTLLEELSAPPVLVYPDWDAVADNPRPFLLFCDASRRFWSHTRARIKGLLNPP